MVVYAVILLRGGLPDEVRILARRPKALRVMRRIRKRLWGDNRPPEDDRDEKHDLYLITQVLERR